MNLRVLILDIVHGGEILAEEYLKRGHSVDCVDVYGSAKEDTISGLEGIGASFHRKVPKGHYDILMMPVHCPDAFLDGVTYDERRSFHQAVGELSEGRSRIEVTGVKGKTSCCYLLAHILALDGRSIFLHTSRGRGEWKYGEHRIEGKASIAPTSILRLPCGHDTVIAEVSLGGSGRAELTIITNLAEDYGIAADTRKASDAKSSIFSEGKNIVPRSELDVWSKYNKKLICFGGRLELSEKTEIGKPARISIDYDGRYELELQGSYLHLQYTDTIEAVLEACHEMGIPADQVVKGLETFSGVPGRGELKHSDKGWEITDRNPGISHMSVAKTLDTLEKMGIVGDTLVVLDPVDRMVCEKMDTERIRGIVEKKGARFCLAGDDEGASADSTVTLRLIKERYR
ncbi:MAG: coenzyme F430 synthase [Candidatus Methanoplasma sp.]|nr:coenzyme F430 synthase [Candidatus Methanoplasma sp.]